MRRAGTSAPTAGNREPALTRAACLAVSVRGRLGMATTPVFFAAQNLTALQRVYRFAPCMSLCTVHAALHRPCCFASSMLPCTAHAALQRVYRFAPHMPPCTAHAVLQRPCRFAASMPLCSAHAVLYCACRHAASMPPCIVHAALHRAYRLAPHMPHCTTHTTHLAPCIPFCTAQAALQRSRPQSPVILRLARWLPIHYTMRMRSLSRRAPLSRVLP